MNSRFGKLVSLTAVAAALSIGPALSQDYGAEWDLNADGALSQPEFADGLVKRGILQAWDADRDARISRTEFDNGVFDTYDGNRSDGLDQSEHGVADAGAANYWSTEGVNYQAWDIDGDEALTDLRVWIDLLKLGKHAPW